MVKKITLLSLVIIAILLAGTILMAAQIYLPKTGNVAIPSSAANSMNIFNGRITNAKVGQGEIVGFTSYDANCVSGQQQLTECDAGIYTNEYGELNFHYQHNMAIQPCLHMFGSEKVVVDILDSSGNAKVTRTIDVSKMGMH